MQAAPLIPRPGALSPYADTAPTGSPRNPLAPPGRTPARRPLHSPRPPGPLRRLAALIALVAALAPALPATAAPDPSAASVNSSAAVAALPVASVAVVGASASAIGASLAVVGASAVATSAAAAQSTATVLSTVGQWTVMSVQVSAEGMLWLLERADDGTRIVIRLADRSARLDGVASGRRLTIQPVIGGWLIGQDGYAIAWAPSPTAPDLSFHQRLR